MNKMKIREISGESQSLHILDLEVALSTCFLEVGGCKVFQTESREDSKRISAKLDLGWEVGLIFTFSA